MQCFLFQSLMTSLDWHDFSNMMEFILCFMWWTCLYYMIWSFKYYVVYKRSLCSHIWQYLCNAWKIPYKLLLLKTKIETSVKCEGTPLTDVCFTYVFVILICSFTWMLYSVAPHSSSMHRRQILVLFRCRRNSTKSCYDEV